jgi:hypothetical protein
MTTDRSTITASEIGQILVATASTKRLEGKSRVLAVDRQATPTLNMFRALKGAKARPVQGGFKTTVKSERGGSLQFYSGRDKLTFDSYETMFDLEFFMGSCHMGDEWVHQIFKEAGVPVVPENAGELPKLKDDTWEIVLDLAKEKMEDLENNYVQALNKSFWRSNVSDPKAFTGMDGILPTTNSTGNIGGKSRSNPILRHQVIASMTIDTLELNLSQVVRAANKKNAMDNSRVSYAVAGEAFYDKLKDLYLGTSTRAGKVTRQWMDDMIGKMNGKIGVGLPDETLYIPGLGALALETIFEDLDVLDAPAIPWSKRIYGFNMEHIGFKADKSLDGFLRVNPTPDDQMVTRISMLGDYTFTVDKPNSHFVGYIS